MRKTIVFYDGGCPLCSKEIKHYQGIDKQQSVVWKDITTEPSELKKYGVTYERAMQVFHVLSNDGVMRTGAEAFVELWKQLPYYRWLGHIVSTLRLTPLLQKAYMVFAKRRYQKRCQSS